MSEGPNTYYMNPDTQERIRVTWTVHLSMPAGYDGVVEIEAATGEEAAALALGDHFNDVYWSDWRDSSSTEVVDVECEDPPEGAVLICPAWNSNANLSALFEPVADAPAQLTGPWGELVDRVRELGIGGEDLLIIEAVMRRNAELHGV
jgi:hypothetical protein